MKSIKPMILMLLIAILAAIPAYAHRFGPGDHTEGGKAPFGHIERMKERLDLTAEQQEKIQTIVLQNRESTRPLHEKARAIRDKMNELLGNENLDQAQLREVLDEQAQIRADIMIAKHDTRDKIDQLLTPEQQQLHQEMRQQRLQHRQDHREHAGEYMGEHKNGFCM